MHIGQIPQLHAMVVPRCEENRLNDDKNELNVAAADVARPNLDKRTNRWKHLAGHGATAALIVAALAVMGGCLETAATREAEIMPVIEPTAIAIIIDPSTAKVGDAVHEIQRDRDGDCPDSAPSMEISVEVETDSQSGVTVRIDRESCEIVIEEIEGNTQP